MVSRHQASGNRRLGLMLALTTMLLWGTLPISLKLAMTGLDPWTLTWFRFAFAAVVLGIWLGARGDLKTLKAQPKQRWALLLLAAVMLIGNYVFYLFGLRLTTPANAQLLIQAAPLLLALGGIWLFRERYNRWQWLGLALTLVGLCLFFKEQLGNAAGGDSYLSGALLIGLAAVVWAIYGLAQKQLLLHLKSSVVLWVIYVIAVIVLAPTAQISHLGALSLAAWLALLYCAINTLAAYGAFAEALEHWDASRVSAILALSPVATYLCSLLAHQWMPTVIRAESIAWIGVAGGLLVIGGAMLTSLARQSHASLKV